MDISELLTLVWPEKENKVILKKQVELLATWLLKLFVE